MKNIDFVHLHVHTDHSMLDGMCRIPDLIQRTRELGMSSVSQTDHGTLSGSLEFYKKSKDEGVKPIVGIEVNCVPNMTVKEERTLYHLVLLAKDEIGYRNLLKISSDGYTKGFYYKWSMADKLRKAVADQIKTLWTR